MSLGTNLTMEHVKKSTKMITIIYSRIVQGAE